MNKNNSYNGPTRRKFLKGAAATATASSVGGLGLGSLFATPASAVEYAPGMTGGPTGFDESFRFQYNETMSEGRAIQGIKALQAAVKAPTKLRVLMPDGCIDQISNPFRTGADAPMDVWKRETGIEVEFVPAPVGDIFKKVMQDVTTGGGTFDVYCGPWNSSGDLVAANGALDCTDFVSKYQPDWGDPARGVPTEELVKLLYTNNDRFYTISLDGDFQTWYYLKGIYDMPEVQDAFQKEVGRELLVPNTWEEQDQIAKFFTGKDFGNGTMYGTGSAMGPFWGLPTFYMRLASMDNPNYYFFNDDGQPNMNSDLAVQACEEHVRSLEWAHPDALSFTFIECWNAIWNLQAPSMVTYTALPKFGDGYSEDGTRKSLATGLIDSHLPLGRKFGNVVNRRSILHYGVSAWVASTSANQEAAYLFLQWLSSTRTFTLTMCSPTGFFDPMQQANFDERLVAENYGPYAMSTIPETVKRSVPGVNFAGQTALDNALDEELQAALTKQKTPREAMDAVQGKWEQIVKRQSGKGMVESIQAWRRTWPTIVDEI